MNKPNVIALSIVATLTFTTLARMYGQTEKTKPFQIVEASVDDEVLGPAGFRGLLFWGRFS